MLESRTLPRSWRPWCHFWYRWTGHRWPSLLPPSRLVGIERVTEYWEKRGIKRVRGVIWRSGWRVTDAYSERDARVMWSWMFVREITEWCYMGCLITLFSGFEVNWMSCLSHISYEAFFCNGRPVIVVMNVYNVLHITEDNFPKFVMQACITNWTHCNMKLARLMARSSFINWRWTEIKVTMD